MYYDIIIICIWTCMKRLYVDKYNNYNYLSLCWVSFIEIENFCWEARLQLLQKFYFHLSFYFMLYYVLQKKMIFLNFKFFLLLILISLYPQGSKLVLHFRFFSRELLQQKNLFFVIVYQVYLVVYVNVVVVINL